MQSVNLLINVPQPTFPAVSWKSRLWYIDQ